MSGQGGRVPAAVAIMFRSGADGGRLAPMPTPMPNDWQRALVVAAHPDDIEYGLAAAVAVWTAAGKEVHYLLATRGEAGMAGVPPEEAGPLREEEERRSAAVVGVTEVEFLDHRDGVLVAGPELRRDLAAAIRRHQPELVVTGYFGATWTPPGVSPAYVNSADHRALGQSRARRRRRRVATSGSSRTSTSRRWRGVAVHRGERDARPAARGGRQRPGGEGGRVADRAPPVPRAAVGRPLSRSRHVKSSTCRRSTEDGRRRVGFRLYWA